MQVGVVILNRVNNVDHILVSFSNNMCYIRLRLINHVSSLFIVFNFIFYFDFNKLIFYD